MSQLTITQDGHVLAETVDGITMPADYSFATVNDYVHSQDRIYEELECLCLGMACHIDGITKQRDELLAALQSISNITGDAGFNIGGPLEHCPGEIDFDEAKRLLSLACEYLKDISKAASRTIASVKGGAA